MAKVETFPPLSQASGQLCATPMHIYMYIYVLSTAILRNESCNRRNSKQYHYCKKVIYPPSAGGGSFVVLAVDVDMADSVFLSRDVDLSFGGSSLSGDFTSIKEESRFSQLNT